MGYLPRSCNLSTIVAFQDALGIRALGLKYPATRAEATQVSHSAGPPLCDVGHGPHGAPAAHCSSKTPLSSELVCFLPGLVEKRSILHNLVFKIPAHPYFQHQRTEDQTTAPLAPGGYWHKVGISTTNRNKPNRNKPLSFFLK